MTFYFFCAIVDRKDKNEQLNKISRGCEISRSLVEHKDALRLILRDFRRNTKDFLNSFLLGLW